MLPLYRKRSRVSSTPTSLAFTAWIPVAGRSGSSGAKVKVQESFAAFPGSCAGLKGCWWSPNCARQDRTRSEDQPDYVPVEADAISGEILWQREDLPDAVGRDCFDGRVGLRDPEGGLVTTACGHELVFLDHRDDTIATVVSSPNYFDALPNQRDVDAYVDGITSIGGGRVSLSPAQKEAYAAGYREEPKRHRRCGGRSLMPVAAKTAVPTRYPNLTQGRFTV